MLYDIYHLDRTMDRDVGIDLWGRAPRGAVAINKDWDGHVYVERRGQWVEGRRIGANEFGPAHSR